MLTVNEKETASRVTYSRADVTDEWAYDTTNHVQWPETEPPKNRKARLAEKSLKRKLKKRLQQKAKG